MSEERVYPISSVEFQRSPVFGVLLYLCLHRLTQDQIRPGGACFRRSACHCICTNGSRGLLSFLYFIICTLNKHTKLQFIHNTHDFYFQGKTWLVLLLRTFGDWNEAFFIWILNGVLSHQVSCSIPKMGRYTLMG